MIATLPSRLGPAIVPVPVEWPPMPRYMVWHLRHQADPVHRWMRKNLEWW